MKNKPDHTNIQESDAGYWEVSFHYDDCKFVHPHQFVSSVLAKESVEMYKDFDFLRYYMEGTQFTFYGSVHDNEESGVIGDTKEDALDSLVEYLLDSADPEDYGLACDVDIDTLYNIIKDRVYKENGIDVERVFVGDVFDLRSGSLLDEHYEQAIDGMVHYYHETVVDSVDDDWRRVQGDFDSEEAMLRCEMRRIYGERAHASTDLYIPTINCPPYRFIKMEK